MHNLQIRKINDGKFMVSINDIKKFFVEQLYFLGKQGSDANDYVQAVKDYTKSTDNIETISLSNLRNIEPDKKILIIYVDTPFSYRFENMLKLYQAKTINKIVEDENIEFSDVESVLKKFQHLIIQ